MNTRLHLTLLPLLALLACQEAAEDDVDTDTDLSDTDSDTMDTDSDTEATSAVRVVHASPDAPAVDVYVAGDDTPLLSDFAYGDTSPFVDLPEGTHTIELRPAGAAPSSAAAYSQELTVPAGETITVMAVGLLASSATDEAFRLQPFVHGFDVAGSGNAVVRIVHASPTAPTVAVDVGNDGTPEVAALARFGETGAAGVQLPADAALQIGIWAGEPLARVTAFTTPDLPEGAELFVVATGLLSDPARVDTGFSLLAVGPEGTVGFVRQNPRVYALHASPGAPDVDVFAGDAELIDDLAYGELAGPLQVPPAAYTLDFFGHAAGSTRPGGAAAATSTTPALAAGETYLAVATGFLGGDPGFQLVAVADGLDVDDTHARIRVVHASPDAPAVDVGTVAAGQVTAVTGWTDLAFGDSSDAAGVSLPASTYDLGLAATGTTAAVLQFSDVAIDAGARLHVVAAGELGDGGFQLMVVDSSTSPWTVSAVDPDAI